MKSLGNNYKIRRVIFSLPILSFLLFLSGKLLRPVALSADTLLNEIHVLGVASWFGFWLVTLYSWGKIVRYTFWFSEIGLGAELGLGSLVYVIFAQVFGHLGWIGQGSEIYFVSFGLLGALGLSCLGTHQASQSSNLRKLVPTLFEILPYLILAYFFVGYVFSAALPQFHSDPLMYHLVGPRVWFEQEKIDVISRIPNVMHCTYWEYLFIWANSLLAEKAGKGILEVQIFSQWIHVFGWAGSALVLFRIFKDKTKKAWIGYVILAGMSSGFLSWTIPLAKNDWGTVFWTLCAFYFLREGFLITSGIFIGLAFAAKFTSIFTLLPLVLAWAVIQIQRSGFLYVFKKIFKIGLAFTLTALPLLIRNSYATGNPFYPALDHWFHSPWFSKSQIHFFAIQQGLASATISTTALKRFELIFLKDPLTYLLLPLLAYSAITKKWNNEKTYFLAAGIGYFLFIFMVGGGTSLDDGTASIRLFGPGLVLVLSSSIALLFEFADKQFKEDPYPFKIIALTTAILITFPLSSRVTKPWEVVHQIRRAPYALATLATGGGSKIWLNQNATRDDFIITTGDNQIYYMGYLKVSSMLEQPWLDEIARKTYGSVLDFLESITSLDTRFLLDSNHFESYYWSGTSAELQRELKKYPDAVIFEDSYSRVIDPNRLLSDLMKSCPLQKKFHPEWQKLLLHQA